VIVEGEPLREFFERLAGRIPEKAHFIGRWEGGQLLGVVAIWNHAAGINAEVGWAGATGWLTRGFLRVVFAYLFGQLHLQRVTGRIHDDNAAAIEASTRLGFVHEGTLRHARRGGDVLVYGLIREECRYGTFR
jgi:RimJ/RimL family protein N-acetyltransferase